MNSVFIYLICFSLTSFQPASFKTPKFDGMWEAFSKNDPAKLIGTLELEAYNGIKGKAYYTVKYWYQNDEKQAGSNEDCTSYTFSMMGEYDGANTISTDMKGLTFTYSPTDGTILTTADLNDGFFKGENCIGGTFKKKAK